MKQGPALPSCPRHRAVCPGRWPAEGCSSPRSSRRSSVAHAAGIVLVPLAAVLLAIATGRRIARVRPDEAWVGRWLVLGVVVKLTASYFRYHTLVDTTRGGRRHGLRQLRPRSSRRHGWVTARRRCCPTCAAPTSSVGSPASCTTCSASNMVAGFFVFGLLALVGSYLWYRATATRFRASTSASTSGSSCSHRASPSGRRRSARKR